MKMIKSIDWLSIITLTGIIMSFLILDIGVRYFTGRQISFIQL